MENNIHDVVDEFRLRVLSFNGLNEVWERT